MEFNSQYLKYYEYKQLGGKLEEVPFNLAELEARKKVDELTLGRLKNLPTQLTEVKACIFRLIEVMTNIGIGNVRSESIDGYSVNYGDATPEQKSKIYNDIVRGYLLTCKLEDGTPYLYCGVE